MIRLLAGGKGEGKTKKLIDMANASVKTTEGHIVFIDDDRRHMFDLQYDIRFVETADYPLSNYREFVGFVCGILSQDNDIVEIYVDGLTNIIKNFDNEALLKLRVKLDRLTETHGVQFVISLNCNPDELPEEIKPLMV